MRWLNLAVGSLLLVGAAVFMAVKFGAFHVQQLERRVDELEAERDKLIEFAQRLGSSRRVAQIDVVRQRRDERGNLIHTLLWREIGDDGTQGRPVAVEAVGRLVYFEAQVIKFDHNYVQEGDPERGQSIVMFRRIFGDQQAPESVADIDRAAHPPTSADGAATLHAELWNSFWAMIDDPKLAEQYGVRVVQCEAPAVPLKLDEIWEVSVDAAGGLNLRKIGIGTGSDPAAMGREHGLIP